MVNKPFAKRSAARGRQAQIHRVQGTEIVGAVRRSLERGATIIVAAGGDGTVNAVAAELVGRDDAALALYVLRPGSPWDLVMHRDARDGRAYRPWS